MQYGGMFHSRQISAGQICYEWRKVQMLWVWIVHAVHNCGCNTVPCQNGQGESNGPASRGMWLDGVTPSRVVLHFCHHDIGQENTRNRRSHSIDEVRPVGFERPWPTASRMSLSCLRESLELLSQVDLANVSTLHVVNLMIILLVSFSYR